MVFCSPNTKVLFSINQGNTGSIAGIDIGSCISDLGLTSYSRLDFTYNHPPQNLLFSVPQNRPKEERFLPCGSLSIVVVESGSKIGFITFEMLHDLEGPNGISQISPQIVVRNMAGKCLGSPYKPKELHEFDLNQGKVFAEINLNSSRLFYKEIGLRETN
ncbi:hypothetical protein J4474_04830 [Candidatus Pacearchaeota archaeon]|nr:hypothetical protein [Candidatus Pacearchaeota archaeon]